MLASGIFLDNKRIGKEGLIAHWYAGQHGGTSVGFVIVVNKPLKRAVIAATLDKGGDFFG